MKKVLLTTAFAVMMCMCAFAQKTYEHEWNKPPKPSEKEIGIVTSDYYQGRRLYVYDSGYSEDTRTTVSEEKLYEFLLIKAKQKYGDNYPNYTLRSFKSNMEERDVSTSSRSELKRYYVFSATVVIPDAEATANEKLSQALDKALRNVREGSRLAIDQVSVRTGMNREDYKDLLIDVLLDKGYKVVAKEYLEQLYEEQQNQQSGIYNERTTVQENNFSAVGYYINVKVTETSLRVQVVNVSTGEYEGNATVNF